MAPDGTSSTSSSPFANNAVDYTLDHRRAASSPKPHSSGDLTTSPDTRLEAQEAMRSCALQILEQPLEMLRTGIVDDQKLTVKSRSVAGSTVGKHLRHVLDHFRLLLDALDEHSANISNDSNGSTAASSSSSSSSTSAQGLPIVDYDRRSRSLPIETSASEALAEFERTQHRISALLDSPDGSALDRPLVLRATTPILQEFHSTLGREVWFIALHSIHHFALARVILNELGVKENISKEFGVAPSTLVFREWSKAQKNDDQARQSQSGGERAKL